MQQMKLKLQTDLIKYGRFPTSQTVQFRDEDVPVDYLAKQLKQNLKIGCKLKNL